MIAEENAKEFPNALLRTGNGVKMFMWAGRDDVLFANRDGSGENGFRLHKKHGRGEKFGRKRTKGKQYEANRRKYGYAK